MGGLAKKAKKLAKIEKELARKRQHETRLRDRLDVAGVKLKAALAEAEAKKAEERAAKKVAKKKKAKADGEEPKARTSKASASASKVKVEKPKKERPKSPAPKAKKPKAGAPEAATLTTPAKKAAAAPKPAPVVKSVPVAKSVPAAKSAPPVAKRANASRRPAPDPGSPARKAVSRWAAESDAPDQPPARRRAARHTDVVEFTPVESDPTANAEQHGSPGRGAALPAHDLRSRGVRPGGRRGLR